jgi:hypothetical protein
MPDGQDYTQDQDFLAAAPARQHAYLMSVDPDYAKAPPLRRQAYITHLTGKAGLTNEDVRDQSLVENKAPGTFQRAPGAHLERDPNAGIGTGPEIPKPYMGFTPSNLWKNVKDVIKGSQIFKDRQSGELGDPIDQAAQGAGNLREAAGRSSQDAANATGMFQRSYARSVNVRSR